jgi:DNA-binding CsgD family transcriptional regulator
MDGRLGVLGVGPQGEELYRHVLRAPGLTLGAHVAQLGWTDYEAEHAIEQLRARRLVRVTDLGEVVADHPRAALERVVSAEEARLATRRQDLARVRDAIDAFVTDHRAGQESQASDQPVRERVDQAVFASVYEHLVASTVGLIRQAKPGEPRAADDFPTVRQQLSSGREQRTLYSPEALQAYGGALAAWASLGEQQRIVSGLPSEFVVFGDEVAIGSTEWGQDGGDYVLLRDPMVVAAFIALFDRLWAAATPAEHTDDPSAKALVEWMQQGLTDEAIARAMGVSLRTVRRRIAAMMSEHGVTTRFQLALRIAERRHRA